MNKIITAIAIIIVLALNACQNACDIKEDIGSLKRERNVIQMQLSNERSMLSALQLKTGNIQRQQSELDSTADYLEALQSGNVRYVLQIEGKQSHFSLSISEHAKDAMNAFTFEIPVDAAFYKNINVGDHLVDEFRSGSLFMKGSLGEMKLTVIGKRISK
jgi:hypothetical protein